MSKSFTVRGLPDDLIEKVDAYSRKAVGPGGKPSRSAAIRSLLEIGLVEGVQRGDGSGAVERKA